MADPLSYAEILLGSAAGGAAIAAVQTGAAAEAAIAIESQVPGVTQNVGDFVQGLSPGVPPASPGGVAAYIVNVVKTFFF